MITLSNAENALKTIYLGVLSDQLNMGMNPLLAKIEKTSVDVVGNEIKKLAPFGLNGGVGAGSENGALPLSGGNKYALFTLALKNFFGKIEISDKAVRASENNSGAFVNLLNAEMEGLLKASRFNFGRMIYGDGNGLLATLTENALPADRTLTVDSVKNITVGMRLDISSATGVMVKNWEGARVVSVDRVAKKVVVEYVGTQPTAACPAGGKVYLQNSKGKEITGLEAVFGTSDTLYGLSRSEYPFLKPYNKALNAQLEMADIQDAIDYVDETAGSTVDIIMSSFDVRRSYVNKLAESRTNMDYMTLDGGFKAISYGGIPMVADKFITDGTMYLLNSEDFKLHQLCDWRWLEGNGGNVLRQVPDKAVYQATLVKYADMLCEKPMGQAKISGILPYPAATGGEEG